MGNLVKTYADVSKLVIWGDSDAADNNSHKPRLIFSFRDGNPRFVVYTGKTGVEGIINFPSDYPTMVGIINLLKDIAKGEPGEKYAVDSSTVVYSNDKPTNEKRVVSTLYIGKSKEGLVYLSVISEGKPKLVFTVKTSPFHSFRDGNKAQVPDSVVSERITLGLCDLILDILSRIIVDYTYEEYAGGKKQTTIKGDTRSSSSTTSQVSKDISSDIDDLGL